jgi:hypothetical protein
VPRRSIVNVDDGETTKAFFIELGLELEDVPRCRLRPWLFVVQERPDQAIHSG